LHASRIAAPGVEVAKHQNHGARNSHRVISSYTRILKAAPDPSGRPPTLRAPARLADPLQSRSDDGMLQDAAWGALMDVVVWLRSLCLGKYEAAFRENDIDGTVAPSVTHENLKELGIAWLGCSSIGLPV
jgi:SAM domain (Sterile alpha motif)